LNLLRSDDLPGPPAENAGPRGRPVSKKKTKRKFNSRPLFPCYAPLVALALSDQLRDPKVSYCSMARVIFVEVELGTAGRLFPVRNTRSDLGSKLSSNSAQERSNTDPC
jgi:hypothetical protein